MWHYHWWPNIKYFKLYDIVSHDLLINLWPPVIQHCYYDNHSINFKADQDRYWLKRTYRCIKRSPVSRGDDFYTIYSWWWLNVSVFYICCSAFWIGTDLSSRYDWWRRLQKHTVSKGSRRQLLNQTMIYVVSSRIKRGQVIQFKWTNCHKSNTNSWERCCLGTLNPYPT